MVEYRHNVSDVSRGLLLPLIGILNSYPPKYDKAKQMNFKRFYKATD